MLRWSTRYLIVHDTLSIRQRTRLIMSYYSASHIDDDQNGELHTVRAKAVRGRMLYLLSAYTGNISCCVTLFQHDSCSI